MIVRRFWKPEGERFREIRRDGAVVTLIVGKLGSAGIGQPTRYPTEADAIALFDEKVAGYLANGLVELSADVAEAHRAASGPPGLSKELTLAESTAREREREANAAKAAARAAEAPRLAEERRAAEEARRAVEEQRARVRAALHAERERRAAGLGEWPAPPTWLEHLGEGTRWGIAVHDGVVYETRAGRDDVIDPTPAVPPESAEETRDRRVEKRRVSGWIPHVDPGSIAAPNVVAAEPRALALDAPAAWRRIRATWVTLSQVARVGPTASWRRTVRANGRQDDHIGALLRFDSEGCPEPLDARGEALAMTMLEHLAASSSAHREAVPGLFVDFWVATAGVLSAFDALERLDGLGVFVDSERQMYPCTGVHHTDWPSRFLAWRRLRDHLDAAVGRGDAKVYATAAKLMRSRFDARAPQMKAAYMIAFPRERSVVAHGARLLLEFPEFPRYGLQPLGSEFDGARAKRLLERASDVEIEGVGPTLDDLVDAAGEGALEPLAYLLSRARAERDAGASERTRWTQLCKTIGGAMGRVLSPLARTMLAEGFDDPELFGGLVTNALHQPALWIDRCATAAASGGPRGTKAAVVLTWMLRRAPELRSSRVGGGGARRALRLAAARASRGRESASADHPGIPEVLRGPAWSRAEPAPERPVVALGIAEDAPSMRWSAVPGGRAAWSRTDATREARARGRSQMEIDRDAEAAFDAAREGLVKPGALDPELLVDASASIALAAWREVPGRAWQEDVVALRAFVARHELGALGGLLSLAEHRMELVAPLLLPFASSRLAPLAARALGAVEVSEQAAAWLGAYPDVATRGLLHVLLAAPSDARDEADRAIHRIARAGGRDRAVGIAQRVSKEAARVVALACDADPSTRRPDQGAQTPTGWDGRALPAPLLSGTSLRLPEAAMRALGELVGTFALPPDHPWIEAVRASLDAESLADLARELVVRWVSSSAVSVVGTLRAIEWFADVDGVRLVADLAREADDALDWGRASLFLSTIERLAAGSSRGDGVALHAVNELVIVEHRARSQQTRSYAKNALGRIARARALAPEELKDVSVPDFGLDACGTLVLDLGGANPRVFRVGFDEHLEPFVRGVGPDGAASERLERLPEPIDSDDPEKSADAEVAWRRLKRDVHALASVAIARLEDAMCTRRRIPRAAFEAHVEHHPLLRHLARRVLFQTESGAIFRIAEDGSFADEDDATFEGAVGASIGILHPLDLSPEAHAKWSRILEDYELLQPFPQLRRPTYRHPPDALDVREIDGFAATERVHAERRQILFRKGWTIVAGQRLVRAFDHAPYDVVLELTRPTFSAVPGAASVRALRFVAHGSASSDSLDDEGLRLRDVHPVDVSEGVLTARWATGVG